MRKIKWLYPGLGVKRWLALSFGGLILIMAGLAMALNYVFVSSLIFKVRFFVFTMVGLVPSTVAGILVIGLGILLSIGGFHRMMHSVIKVLLPRDNDNLVEILYNNRFLQRGPRVVAIGGGTGLSVLLRGLKKYTCNITAIVAVSDDGGSSGRLRDDLGILPPGDVRNCLVALADTEGLMEEVFNYRFRHGSGLAGHSLGNLFLAGMTDIVGRFDQAILEASKVLAVRGRVLPATLDDVVLVAETADGVRVEGETRITAGKKPIRRVSLRPADCRPTAEALRAIAEADMVVIGPGSLYTSVIPNLLVPEMADALRCTKATVVYVCNTVTQPGETDYYTVSDHLQAIVDHCGDDIVDFVAVNVMPVPVRFKRQYQAQGIRQVVVDNHAAVRLGSPVIKARLMDEDEPMRHHPDRLAGLILNNLLQRRSARGILLRFRLRVGERLRRLVG